MQRVIFSADDNTVTLDGQRFVAQEGKPGKCDGCVMKSGFGCRLAEVGYIVDPSAPLGVTRCQPQHRKDARQVVWVSRAHAKR